MKILFRPHPSQKNQYETILESARLTRLWKEHAGAVLWSLQKHSGLNFRQSQIIVYVGKSIQTHSGDTGMAMQIAYNHNQPYSREPFDSDEELLGHLIHELAHRLLICNGIVTKIEGHGHLRNLIGHRRIYLFLYDVLIDVMGKARAEHEVQFEKDHLRKAFGDAWEWALSKSYQQRQQSLKWLRRRPRNKD